MGLFDRWSEAARVKQAAKELWQALRRGYNLEVPLVFDRNDLTLRAVVELQNTHPEVELRMYQSKGIVLGLFRNDRQETSIAKVSAFAYDMLKKGGSVGTGKVNIEDLLFGHEAWLRSQGMDPAKQEEAAQRDEAEKRAITVSDSTAEVLKQQSEAVEEKKAELKVVETE